MNQKKTVFGAAIIFLAMITASARAEDRVILIPQKDLKTRCDSLAARGITCKFIPASNIDDAAANAHLWVPVDGIDLGRPMDVSADRLSFVERMTGQSFYGQALIYSRSDPSGQTYAMVRPAVITHVGTADPAVVDGKDDVVWGILDTVLPTAPAESEPTRQFLSSDDAEAEKLAANKAAEAKRDADQRAFLASPAYKQQQLREAAAQCQKTIAYANSILERDDRMAAISGLHNVSARQSAAAMIVDCQDTIQKSNTTQLRN